MAQINFGLLGIGQNGFQNALANGLQAGQAVAGMVQAREDAQRRNALADVLLGGQGDPSQGAPQGMPQGGGGLVASPEQQAQLEQRFPNAPAYGQEAQGGVDPAMRRLAELDPDTFMRVQGQRQSQDAQQAQRRQADAGTFRRLLQRAGQSPEGWQQAMGAAQQLGLNVANVPQQYDPVWAQQQLFIHDALSDPATATAVVNDVVAMGLDPETPEGRAAVQELTLYKYAKQTTDEQGRPSLSMPTIAMPGQQTQQAQGMPQGGGFAALPEQQGAPAPGAVEDGYRFRGGDPADPASWEQVGQQAPQMTVTPRELDALVRRFGPQEVQRRLDSGIVAVRN